MKKLVFASICLFISITISKNALKLSKNKGDNFTISTLVSNASAADIESVDIICNSSPGVCWSFRTYTFYGQMMPCCIFSGWMSNSCSDHEVCP